MITRDTVIRIGRRYGHVLAEDGPDCQCEISFSADQLVALLEFVAVCEREACAKVADSISEDQWALYKGRPPYTGRELERASDYTQGKSDGAEICAYAIRERGQA